MKPEVTINNQLIDAIIERPKHFYIDDTLLSIYPASLGKTYLVARLIDSIGAGNLLAKKKPETAAVSLCRIARQEVIRIIAFYTVKKKEDHFDEELLKSRCELIGSLDDNGLATLLLIVLDDDNTDSFIRHYGIDKEKNLVQRIVRHKRDNGNLSFGGMTVYGTLIDSACERYGWTFDYVVWGLSYTNLRMLTADAPVSMYLSKEDMKKLHISADREIISASDPKNFDRIRKMLED